MAENVRSCGRLSWLITRPVLIARNVTAHRVKVTCLTSGVHAVEDDVTMEWQVNSHSIPVAYVAARCWSGHGVTVVLPEIRVNAVWQSTTRLI